MTDSLPRPLLLALLSFLIIFGAWLRVSGVSAYHYSEDERMELAMSSEPDFDRIVDATRQQTHPPFGHFIRHFWLHYAHSPAAIRALALVFGLALIPLFYLIGRQLGGDGAGLAAAALVTVSSGCIIQSYVVRNYTLFLLLLSLSLYFLLRFRETRATTPLAGYAFFIFLACCTHYSGLFALGVMGGTMTLTLWRAGAMRDGRRWLIANVLCGLPALFLMLYWQSTALAPARDYVKNMIPGTLWAESTQYMPTALPYLLFDTGSRWGMVAECVLALGLLGFGVKKGGALSNSIFMATVALLLGLFLFAQVLYPFVGSRHELWLLPFMLPPLAAAFYGLFPGAGLKASPLPAVLITCAGCLFYSPEVRFHTTDEYMLREANARALFAVTRRFGPNERLLVTYGDAFLFEGIVTPYDSGAYSTGRVTSVPYAATTMLYDRNRADFQPDTLIRLAEDARKQGKMANVTRLNFLITRVSGPTISPVEGLALCGALPKTITAFPPLAPGEMLTKSDFSRKDAILLQVDADVFFAALDRPTPSLLACLRE